MTKWLALAAVLGGIVLGTHCSSGMAGEILRTLGITDSTAHMLIYGVLGGTIVLAGTGSFGRIGTMIVLAIFLAAADEITQPLVGRDASLTDFLFDMIGLGIGGLSVLIGRVCVRQNAHQLDSVI